MEKTQPKKELFKKTAALILKLRLEKQLDK